MKTAFARHTVLALFCLIAALYAQPAAAVGWNNIKHSWSPNVCIVPTYPHSPVADIVNWSCSTDTWALWDLEPTWAKSCGWSFCYILRHKASMLCMQGIGPESALILTACDWSRGQLWYPHPGVSSDDPNKRQVLVNGISTYPDTLYVLEGNGPWMIYNGGFTQRAKLEKWRGMDNSKFDIPPRGTHCGEPICPKP